eukprot:CAMPEP_0173313386 /NCGR_PEP_ID=MMETSP1143-20121109/24718_1 /TAXON_ID=483371 /ORGANISM="non described non described, Strain CCMP2298" /LENGTH=134 /DNA_ID=CAMNT_0014255805 /DNA_START=961 /DNA_END=1365 /DNA_ORIENTATION=-
MAYKEEGGGSREMHHGVRQCEGDGLGTMGILAAVLDQDNHSQHRSSHTEDSSHCQLLEGADPREQYERYGEYVDHVVCREVEGLPQRLSEEDYISATAPHARDHRRDLHHLAPDGSYRLSRHFGISHDIPGGLE